MMMIMIVSMGPVEKFEMKVSREKMAENRDRILDVASRLFREKGFDAVSVSEVMKAAGLTHGGFTVISARRTILSPRRLTMPSQGATAEASISGLILPTILRPGIATILPPAVPRRALPRISATRRRLPAPP